MQQLEDDGERNRAQPDENRAPAVLRRKHARVAEELVPFADHLAETIEHLGQVAARRPLDRDGRAEEFYILGWNALLQSSKSLADIAPESHFLGDASKLGTYRVPHLLPDQLDGAAERMARPDSAGHHVHRVGEVALEPIDSLVCLVAEEQDRKRPGPGRSGDEAEGAAQA